MKRIGRTTSSGTCAVSTCRNPMSAAALVRESAFRGIMMNPTQMARTTGVATRPLTSQVERAATRLMDSVRQSTTVLLIRSSPRASVGVRGVDRDLARQQPLDPGRCDHPDERNDRGDLGKHPVSAGAQRPREHDGRDKEQGRIADGQFAGA